MLENYFFRPVSNLISQQCLRDQRVAQLSMLLESFIEVNPAIESIRESLLKIDYQHEFLALEMLIRVILDNKNVTDEEIEQLANTLKKCDDFILKENELPLFNEKLNLFKRRIFLTTTLVAMATSALSLYMACGFFTNDFFLKTCAKKPLIYFLPFVVGSFALVTSIVSMTLLSCLVESYRTKKNGTYAPCNYNDIERDYSRLMEGIWRYRQVQPVWEKECPLTVEELAEIKVSSTTQLTLFMTSN